jgi:NADP-dependent 3-hydroxy acid dehydrogenase YdfG
MEDVEGKTAFITGGASGIGLGMAEAFLAAGMKVAIADIEEEALARATAMLTEYSNAVCAVPLDVTDRDAVDTAEAALGPIQVVCNNAGVTNRGPVDEASYDDWDWVLGVNLGGVINGVHTIVPRIRKYGQGGHVVNTSSIAGLIATAGNGVYATTKYAVLGLSEALRQELTAESIGVSVLCPGAVDTQINHAARNRQTRFADSNTKITEQQTEILDRSMALGMKPREIGEHVLSAIRADAPYILPHAEFAAAYKGRTQTIIDSFSTDPVPADRVEGMKLRVEAFSDLMDSDPWTVDDLKAK